MLPVNMPLSHDFNLIAREAEKGSTVPRKRKRKWGVMNT